MRDSRVVSLPTALLFVCILTLPIGSCRAGRCIFFLIIDQNSTTRSQYLSCIISRLALRSDQNTTRLSKFCARDGLSAHLSPQRSLHTSRYISVMPARAPDMTPDRTCCASGHGHGHAQDRQRHLDIVLARVYIVPSPPTNNKQTHASLVARTHCRSCSRSHAWMVHIAPPPNNHTRATPATGRQALSLVIILT